MSKLQNTRSGITAINNIVVDNNLPSVINALKSYSIVVPNESRDAVVNQLETLFNNNKSEWVKILKKIQYDPNASNYTTDATLRASMLETLNINPQTADINWSNIWSGIGDFVSGSSTTGGVSSSTTTKPAISGGAIAIVLIVIAAIIGVIIWKTK